MLLFSVMAIGCSIAAYFVPAPVNAALTGMSLWLCVMVGMIYAEEVHEIDKK